MKPETTWDQFEFTEACYRWMDEVEEDDAGEISAGPAVRDVAGYLRAMEAHAAARDQVRRTFRTATESLAQQLNREKPLPESITERVVDELIGLAQRRLEEALAT